MSAGRIAVLHLALASMRVQLDSKIRDRDIASDQAEVARGTAAAHEGRSGKPAANMAALRLKIRAEALAGEVNDLLDQIAAVEFEICNLRSEVHHSAPAFMARIQAGQRAVLSADQQAAVDETFGYVARAAA